MDRQGVLAYAIALADKVGERMEWAEIDTDRGYWQALDTRELSIIIATATQALEFFRIYAGPVSFWTRQAEFLYNDMGGRQSRESGARAVGDLLRAWVDQVEHGIIEIVGERVREEVSGARIDLMEQVRQLMLDTTVHPAAPIVLCGAALEIALRAVVQARNVTVEDRPGMTALIKALRHAELITKQDVKELEVCVGIRNLAAHGSFEELTVERAGLMEQQTTILLSRLAELPPTQMPDV